MVIAVFIEVILIVSERFITLYRNKDPKELYYLFIYKKVKKNRNNKNKIIKMTLKNPKLNNKKLL